MSKEKTKVYLYIRVSTAMQIEGYSLDAQKSRTARMKFPLSWCSNYHGLDVMPQTC